jgi:hypothetical protein
MSPFHAQMSVQQLDGAEVPFQSSQHAEQLPQHILVPQPTALEVFGQDQVLVSPPPPLLHASFAQQVIN